jgi:hypothetical protein
VQSVYYCAWEGQELSGVPPDAIMMAPNCFECAKVAGVLVGCGHMAGKLSADGTKVTCLCHFKTAEKCTYWGPIPAGLWHNMRPTVAPAPVAAPRYAARIYILFVFSHFLICLNVRTFYTCAAPEDQLQEGLEKRYRRGEEKLHGCGTSFSSIYVRVRLSTTCPFAMSQLPVHGRLIQRR